jgi:hypothetical protein
MGVVGTGLWAGELDGLVGRDSTLARLRELMVEGGRTAVLLGIPGSGKSAVLAHVSRAAAADGWTVLGVTGHRSDQGLPFAALVDLLASAGVAGALDQVGDDDPLRVRLNSAPSCAPPASRPPSRRRRRGTTSPRRSGRWCGSRRPG